MSGPAYELIELVLLVGAIWNLHLRVSKLEKEMRMVGKVAGAAWKASK